MIKDYYKEVIIPFVDKLVMQYAKKTPTGYIMDSSYIDDFDRDQLIAYMMNDDAHNGDDWCWLRDSTGSVDIANLLSRFIVTSSKDDMYVFIEKLKKESYKAYEPRINELFDKRVSLVEMENNYENGLRKTVYDRTTGETCWV